MAGGTTRCRNVSGKRTALTYTYAPALQVEEMGKDGSTVTSRSRLVSRSRMSPFSFSKDRSSVIVVGPSLPRAPRDIRDPLSRSPDVRPPSLARGSRTDPPPRLPCPPSRLRADRGGTTARVLRARQGGLRGLHAWRVESAASPHG